MAGMASVSSLANLRVLREVFALVGALDDSTERVFDGRGVVAASTHEPGGIERAVGAHGHGAARGVIYQQRPVGLDLANPALRGGRRAGGLDCVATRQARDIARVSPRAVIVVVAAVSCRVNNDRV